jgi:hypothetical protein
VKGFFATIVIVVLTATATPALSQSCKVGVDAPPVGFWMWAPRSQIQVYILESDFAESELPFLLAPLKAWNDVSAVTGSGIKFEYKGTTDKPLYCDNCLLIRRGRVFDQSRRHLTELKSYSMPASKIMAWANIVIDPRLTNRKALTNAIAHELGHSFGLLDCYSCKAGSTAMLQFKDVNVSNEMNGPSACDVAQVKAVYQAVATQLSKVSRPKATSGDEGEEPVDDDTPVVVPKP